MSRCDAGCVAQMLCCDKCVATSVVSATSQLGAGQGGGFAGLEDGTRLRRPRREILLVLLYVNEYLRHIPVSVSLSVRHWINANLSRPPTFTPSSKATEFNPGAPRPPLRPQPSHPLPRVDNPWTRPCTLQHEVIKVGVKGPAGAAAEPQWIPCKAVCRCR